MIEDNLEGGGNFKNDEHKGKEGEDLKIKENLWLCVTLYHLL